MKKAYLTRTDSRKGFPRYWILEDAASGTETQFTGRKPSKRALVAALKPALGEECVIVDKTA